jgi:hypothetical protein
MIQISSHSSGNVRRYRTRVRDREIFIRVSPALTRGTNGSHFEVMLIVSVTMDRIGWIWTRKNNAGSNTALHWHHVVEIHRTVSFRVMMEGKYPCRAVRILVCIQVHSLLLHACIQYIHSHIHSHPL